MSAIEERQKLRGSTRLLYDELVVQQAHPTILSASSSLIEYTDKSGGIRLLFSTCSEKSSAIGRVIAGSKARTALIAEHLSIPTPTAIICTTIRDAHKFLTTHHMIVTKPLGSDGGSGVSTNITTKEQLRRAYGYAKDYSARVIAQQHIVGADVRLLTVGGKFSTAVIREPAFVIGDGISTTLELITHANTTPPRNNPSFLSILPINLQAARRFLGVALQDIPVRGQKIRTTGPANVSLGGSLHEATHLVTPAMIADAEKISRRLGLGICGVDMMWNQEANRHYLIEINATPGIDIHNDPYSGTKSDCVQKYVQWLVS
jgi:cyanophycin synthetase